MAGANSIPFRSSQDQTPFRLVELPQELLDIIITTGQPIYLKSSPGSQSSKEGNLHLVTEKSSWLAKQVSTSNSVYVTSSARKSNEMDIDQSPGITTIAKLSSMLELHPVPATFLEGVVNEQLEKLVPEVTTAEHLPATGLSLAQIYGSISAPEDIITQVLAKRCAVQSSRGIVIPSSRLMLATWKQIIDAATLSSTMITKKLNVTGLLQDEMTDDGHELSLEVAKSMFRTDGYFSAHGLVTGNLKESEMARWVGNLILDTKSDRALDKDSFENTWEEHVPAAWVKYCSVEVLGNAGAIEEKDGMTVVVWRPFGLDGETLQVSNTQSEGQAAKSTAKGKKKNWHEILAGQRAANK